MKLELHKAWCVAIVLIVLSAAPGHAASPDPQSTDPSAAKPNPDQSTLTNDWFGYGRAMRDAGFDSRLEWSQFYQGMPRGDGDKSGQYGGHVDWLVRD